MSRLENSIMEMRHHFIYGKESEERERSIREVVDNNPIVLDQNKPMGIYLDTIGFPIVESDVKGLDSYKLDFLAREYFAFVLWDNLLTKYRESVDVEKEQARIEAFLKRIRNLDNNKAKTIDEYAKAIKTSRDAFLEAYINYFKTGEIEYFIDDLEIPFIMLENSLKKFKELLNNNSFFAVIADHKEPLSLCSYRVINNVVCSRINADISMNVVTEPGKWKTFYCQTGQLAEHVHDYGVIELDDSLKNHVKKLKYKFFDDED